MSGSRGRKVTAGRSGDPRWPNQQPYYNQNASIPDLRSGWDNWNIPPPSSGYGWQPNSNLQQVWPSPNYRGGGYYTEDHLPRSGDFDQFQHRFPNSFTPPSHFSEHSLAHLNQTPLNELSSGGHSGFRDGSSTRDPSSSKQPNSAKDKQNPQSFRSKTADKTSGARNRVPSNPSNNEMSSAAKTQDSVGGVEKQNVPAKSTSFMPPNVDLMNKVKASLNKNNATKDQAPVRTTSSPAEPPVPSSPQKVRESRIPATEASPSARHSIRVAAGSHRRTSQSSSTSNSGANGETQNNPLEGLGFIQNTSNSENLDSVSQANRIRNSSGGSSTHETEPLTTIPKEQLNKYIRSMDNHQRRQLVEQPRSIISQYMLNHLVQENQTARARQLSSLRFRVSSNELESRAENTVILSEELVDEFKELLSRNDEETAKQPDSEEEEIQVLEPPPKVPPLCIDLDLDDKPASPTPSPSLSANSSVPVTQRESISDRNDSTTEFIERELDSQLSAASRPAAAPTPEAARGPETLPHSAPDVPRIPEALLHPTPVSEAATTSQVPCPVSLSHNPSIPTMSVTLQPTQESSTASTSTVPSIITTVSAGKKSFLEKNKSLRKKERREKQANEQTQISEKEKSRQEKKKLKKKDKKRSPTKPRKEKTRLEPDSRSTENAAKKIAEVVDLDKSDNATSAVDRAGTSNQFSDSAGGRSALNFLLTDLQTEEQQGKDRIALIDRTIEELQLERKALTDKVLALKQQQFDLLRSAMSSNSFGNDTVPRPSESVPAPIETPVTMETTDQKDEELPKVASEEATPVQPVPPAASTQLLSLMHQLEENGVQVALGEAVPSDSVPPTNASIGTKRKRIPSDDSKQQKKKSTPTNSPSRNAVGVPPVEKLDQVPTNEAVAQPMQCTPALPQTLSISQINQITSTISSVIAQTVETSCTKKTPTPVTFSNQSKKATSPSESSLAAESHNQSKEIPTAKSQSVSSSPKVTEPKVPEPKPAEPKAVEPKAVEPKAVEPKKSATVAEKAKVVAPKNASRTTEKSAEVTTSRPSENVRTYSRRDEASSKNTTPKPCLPVNSQVSGATGRLPARTTEPSQGKDAAATPSVSTQKSTSSSTTAKQTTSSTTTTASRTNSSNPILLRSHESSVRCVYICGPCAFTASEDGTVHIYDLNNNTLSMRILGHTKPVTWLYGLALNTSGEAMKSIKSTTDYLNHLTLITGSEDAHIRQFALDSGSLMHERFCQHALTCAVGHRLLTKLYVGTTAGTIFSYSPKLNSIRINTFKVNGEVICMKLLNVRGRRALIVAARRMDPVIFDLETQDTLFTLTSNIPSSSFYCMSSTSHFVFCGDANKNLFKFDTNSDNAYTTETLPSAAVSSSLEGNRYLVLGCMDGVIRVLDTLYKPSRIFTLPGQTLKTITCMKIVNGKIVGGSLNGEVAYFQLPNLEALCKVNG